MKRGSAALVALSMLASMACSTPNRKDAMPNQDADSAIPSAIPDIAGIVTAVNGDQFRVEENPADVSGSAKASVRVTPGETRIVRRSGARATAADIAPGSRVSVWFVGPVMESYPVQARAGVVVIE